MSLASLNIGEKATIAAFSPTMHKSYREELAALGLFEGVMVFCVRKSIFGSLLHLKINNTLLVLRKKEASGIEVEILK